MTPIDKMTDEQFEQYTLAILEKELGPVGMARYLRIRGGAGDYTRDRHLWLDRLTFDEAVEQSRKVKIPTSA